MINVSIPTVRSKGDLKMTTNLPTRQRLAIPRRRLSTSSTSSTLRAARPKSQPRQKTNCSPKTPNPKRHRNSTLGPRPRVIHQLRIPSPTNPQESPRPPRSLDPVILYLGTESWCRRHYALLKSRLPTVFKTRYPHWRPWWSRCAV